MTVASKVGNTNRTRRPARRDGVANRRRSGGPFILVAAAAIALAACGGAAGTPHVASLGTSGDGGGGRTTTTTTTTATTDGTSPGSGSATSDPTGNATRLLNEWAACMRRHGDPDQADPTITTDKLIDINWNPAIPGGYGGTNKGGQGNSGPGQYCRSYLAAAQTALGGGESAAPHWTTAQVVKFAECMRDNGVPDFPDPTGNSLVMSIHPGSDLDPRNPTFQSAQKLCARRTGVDAFGTSTPPPGTIELDGQLPG